MQDPTLFQSIRSQGFPEQQEQVIKCPRCDSTNTKFCYYNNYNLSQPRHFCKNCKRYWTKGGALRNIPIGGGSRKNTKRSSSSSSKRSPATSSSSPTITPPVGSSDPTRLHTDPTSGIFKSSLLSSSSASFSSPGDVGIVMEGVNRNGLGLEMAKGGDFGGNLGSGEDGVVDLGSEMQRNDGDLSCWNSGNEWSNLAMHTTPGSRFR